MKNTNSSPWNGATRCERASKFFTRAERDQDRRALDCDDLAHKIFNCSNMENELKRCLTRQTVKNLYGFSISECC